MYNEIDNNMGYPIPLKIRRRWININSVTFVIEWLATAVMIVAAIGIVQKWPSTIWLLNIGMSHTDLFTMLS